MKELITKYDGECKRCGVGLEVGKVVMYEKSMGIFCKGHEPTEVEDIRHFRQIKADAKADKYAGWAAKRRERSERTLNHNHKHYTGDIAFTTQPGHIPQRARVIAQNDRAYESLSIAERMDGKAESLRHVRVKGDAERADIAKRAEVDTWIKPGMMVDTCHAGILKVLKVNKKTVTVEGRFGKFTHDKIYMTEVK